MERRPGLSAERVIDAAARVADRGGLASVSMRNVGAELGVEAMSLYHHVAGKEALLDALADWVFARIPLPVIGEEWRPAMAARAASAREVLSAHPWALGLIESRREPGPALLRHHDTVLGCLLAGGFAIELASHAFSVLDAYVYGFVLTELKLPFEPGETAADFAADLDLPAAEYPHLAAVIAAQVTNKDYAFADEFGFGLDLILDSVGRRLAAAQ